MLTKIKNRLTLRLFPFILYFMAVRKENADEVCFDLSQAAKRIANIRLTSRDFFSSKNGSKKTMEILKKCIALWENDWYNQFY